MTKEEREKAKAYFQSRLEWQKKNRYPYVSAQEIRVCKIALEALKDDIFEGTYEVELEKDGDDAFDVIGRVDTPQPKAGHWIPITERLPELNRPLLVTAYHRVCYAHMISKRGNYGYPVFRLHEIKDSDCGWVQETISHEPYSKGKIDAWMYIDIPEPYKVEPQERSDKE